MEEDQQSRPAQDAYGALMLRAAGVVRVRYVRCTQDGTLSPVAASRLADVFTGLSYGDPEFDQIDPNEAIALAHRLIDDDRPELSSLWPREP